MKKFTFRTVEDELYNTFGDRIFTIPEGRLATGNHTIPVDLTSWNLTAGVYFMVFRHDRGTAVRPLTILK
jgi:hypothetical protein